MAKNLELKTSVRSHIPYRKILQEIGAGFRGIINQCDIYYKSPNGLLKLRLYEKEAELIQYNRDESGKTRWSNYEILKLDPVTASEFLEKLFKVETIVKKKRELWLFGNSRIHLDNVKNLGKFLEIETLVLNGNAEAKKRFNFIKDQLKLNSAEQILSSYRDLMLRKK